MPATTIPWIWIAGIAVFFAGLGIGFLTAGIFGGRKRKLNSLHTELESAKTAHEEYQQTVDQHFQETAGLFEQLSKQHKAVYDHLAEGAHILGFKQWQPVGLLADDYQDLPEKELEVEVTEEPADQQPPQITATEEADADTETSELADLDLLHSTESVPKERELH